MAPTLRPPESADPDLAPRVGEAPAGSDDPELVLGHEWLSAEGDPDSITAASQDSFPTSDPPANSPRSPERTLGDPVQTASEDSFPASDSPSWTSTTGLGPPGPSRVLSSGSGHVPEPLGEDQSCGRIRVAR